MGFDSGDTLAERFRSHAGDDRSLYGFAMRGMADDWEAGGVVREICAGWEDAPPGSVVQLRLLAGVFRTVLRGQAPEPVPFYESLGGTVGPEGVWPGRPCARAPELPISRGPENLDMAQVRHS